MNVAKGAVLRVRRKIGYWHYGVYCGGGRVVQFAPKKGFELNQTEADIVETDLDGFLKGGSLMVDTKIVPRFPPDEIVARARSMLGKEKGEYNLLFNNCEHFARWCVCDEHRSKQVETAAKAAAASAAVAIGVGITAALIKRRGDHSDQA
jgi:hypothetical protein